MTRRLHSAGLASVITALTLTAGMALAAPPSDDPSFSTPPGDRASRLAEELSLDEAQALAMEDMKAGLKAGREEARTELEQLREATDAELAQDEPSSRTLHKLLDEKLAIQADLAHDRLSATLDFRATLSPEQQAEFDALMSRRRAHRHKARGKSGRPPEPGSDGELREQR